MAITFPRTFPGTPRFVRAQFEPEPVQAGGLTGGGNQEAIGLGPSFWVADYLTPALPEAEFGLWEAWFDTLDGSKRTFKGIPWLRRYPLAHEAGFAGMTVGVDPFSGSGNLDDIAAGLDAVTIDELPNGLILGVGDFISIPVGSRQHLHRISEGGTVSAGAVTVGVYPLIRPDAETDVAVALADPWCDMAIPFGQKPTKTWAVSRTGTIAFRGTQLLL